MSKGSRPRPKSVDGINFDNNFESIFVKHFPTYMKKLIPDAPVEIHLDVNRDKKYATGTFSEQVVGYAKSIGVDCKIKPESWASSGIADKHTRHRFNKRQTEKR